MCRWLFMKQEALALICTYKGPLEPFDYIAQFRPLKPPEDIDIEEYKRTQAPTA